MGPYVFHHHLYFPQESSDDGLSGPIHAVARIMKMHVSVMVPLLSPPQLLFGRHYTNTRCPAIETALHPAEQMPLSLSTQDENGSSFQHAVFLEYRMMGSSPTTHNPLESIVTRACWHIHKRQCNMDSKMANIYFQQVPRSTHFSFLYLYIYLYYTIFKKLKERFNPHK
jgi:hypothetical protein